MRLLEAHPPTLLVDAASADGHLSPTEMATIKSVEQALGIK